MTSTARAIGRPGTAGLGARAKVAGRVALLLGSTLLFLLLLELTLRWNPALLGRVFANAALSKYHSRPGGIFYRDRALMNMRFMIPSFETDMYFNGYRWHHKTDALGFRNEAVVDRPDVILLGDSFIYGHAVELDQTVGHFLAEVSGRRVMNLARQGDSAFEEAYLASEFVGRLSPRYVVYFYFENDIADLGASVSEKEMDRFARQDVASISYPPRTDVNVALARRGDAAEPPQDQLLMTKAWKFFGLGRTSVAQAAEDAADERSLPWRYTKKAIRYMKYVSERQGATFIMAPITITAPAQFEILKKLANNDKIPFVDTSSVLTSDRALYLPGDGHFSAKGARAMAEAVAQRIAALQRPSAGS